MERVQENEKDCTEGRSGQQSGELTLLHSVKNGMNGTLR